MCSAYLVSRKQWKGWYLKRIYGLDMVYVLQQMWYIQELDTNEKVGM
jgi:hypothetical protein